ncbi:MAG: tetratricopeptide repeat protein [Saprospiraceae bacterium]|nr:tetratricopeptide repeat protein [Candidatus Vicinibacter affinis]
MGIFDKAEPFYLEAKVIREKVLGRVHPDYAWVLNNLAVLYWSTGNYEKPNSFSLNPKTCREKYVDKSILIMQTVWET